MKKLSITLSAACLGLVLAVSSIAAREYKNFGSTKVLTASKDSTGSANSEFSKSLQGNNIPDKDELHSVAMSMEVPPAFEEKKDTQVLASDVADTEPAESAAVEEQPKVVAVQAATAKSTLSRGGNPPASSSSQTAKTGNVELLDWWKQGNAAFPINSVATVKDVYTGKTFKVKRTMGTNHADTEALTLEDTNIIKSIWGGFNWNVRPIHILINGRTLAASMSAMPHAGLDSAPAFKVIDNRSVGYGRGENLDVVKGNGMDGHFDIHFLNSTRHKDGKIDPRHQAAIKIAASK